MPIDKAELSPEDAWAIYQKEEGFESDVYSQFKLRLKDHRNQAKNQKLDEKPKDPKKEGWINWKSKEVAKARAAIIEDLVQGILPVKESKMSAEEAWTHYASEEGFENIVFSQFENRLKAHRKQVKATIAKSRYEEECLRHDRNLFPRKEVDDDGDPFFDLHPAKQLLEEDIITNNKHKKMKPEELRQSRDEYKVFPKEKFRPRVYQAIRRQRFLNYLKLKTIC